MKSLSRVQLFAIPWTVAYQAPPSMEFSSQEYWSGLPFPCPGDLRNPRIEPRSPSLQAGSLPSEPQGKLKRQQFRETEKQIGVAKVRGEHFKWSSSRCGAFRQGRSRWKAKERECGEWNPGVRRGRQGQACQSPSALKRKLCFLQVQWKASEVF